MTTCNSNRDDGYSLGQSNTTGYSISHSPGYSTSVKIWSHGVGEDCEYCLSAGVSVPRAEVQDGDSDSSEVKRIARTIFTAEVAEVIRVLKTCGTLSTKDDCNWCLAELWRLLKQSPGDLT